MANATYFNTERKKIYQVNIYSFYIIALVLLLSVQINNSKIIFAFGLFCFVFNAGLYLYQNRKTLQVSIFKALLNTVMCIFVFWLFAAFIFMGKVGYNSHYNSEVSEKNRGYQEIYLARMASDEAKLYHNLGLREYLKHNMVYDSLFSFLYDEKNRPKDLSEIINYEYSKYISIKLNTYSESEDLYNRSRLYNTISKGNKVSRGALYYLIEELPNFKLEVSILDDDNSNKDFYNKVILNSVNFLNKYNINK